MTRRQIQLARAVLDYLASLDGGQANDIRIHAAVNEELGGYTPLSEFNEVLELADRAGWIITVKTEFKGVKRSLTDLGEAKRRAMRE